jgi:hypothetical protein
MSHYIYFNKTYRIYSSNLSMCTRNELKLSVSRPKRLKQGIHIRLNSLLALALRGGGGGGWMPRVQTWQGQENLYGGLNTILTMFIHSFIHSFISLFSVYPHTGRTKDVEMVVTDVKVFVRSTDVK